MEGKKGANGDGFGAVLARSLGRVMAGGRIGREEALGLSSAKEPADVMQLASAATRVREKFRGRRAELCALINAKSGACPEDCAYCAQSSRWNTGVEVYGMLKAEDMVERAERLTATGADHVCIVASGRRPSEAELEAVCRAAEMIRKRTRLKVCACLGEVNGEEIRRMRESGIGRYNHNIETSRRHFPSIATTHKWEDRLGTARAVRDGGLELCCGGILGMGEDSGDRVDFALSLRELEPEVVTVNILNPRPGSPLEGKVPPGPLEAVKWIAIFRLMLPRSAIKLAGGREPGLRGLQATAFLAGADGMIVGGYLTTGGRPVSEDLGMLADCGFEPVPDAVK